MAPTDLEKRCPTGIPGLDELIEGGLPRKRTILLSGTCGSGKTTFAVQFLVNGALQHNEPGILISLEQDPAELKEDMARYGFDLQRLEYENKLVIIDASLAHIGLTPDTAAFVKTGAEKPSGSMSLMPDEFNIDAIIEATVMKAKKAGAKRAVFDSLPALDFLISGENDHKIKTTVRRIMIALSYRLKEAGLTTMIITEPTEDGPMSTHGVESYVTDGFLNLTFNEALDNRTLKIKKMRGTKHSLKPHTMEFTEKGVSIAKSASDEKKKMF